MYINTCLNSNWWKTKFSFVRKKEVYNFSGPKQGHLFWLDLWNKKLILFNIDMKICVYPRERERELSIVCVCSAPFYRARKKAAYYGRKSLTLKSDKEKYDFFATTTTTTIFLFPVNSKRSLSLNNQRLREKFFLRWELFVLFDYYIPHFIFIQIVKHYDEKSNITDQSWLQAILTKTLTLDEEKFRLIGGQRENL